MSYNSKFNTRCMSKSEIRNSNLMYALIIIFAINITTASASPLITNNKYCVGDSVYPTLECTIVDMSTECTKDDKYFKSTVCYRTTNKENNLINTPCNGLLPVDQFGHEVAKPDPVGCPFICCYQSVPISNVPVTTSYPNGTNPNNSTHNPSDQDSFFRSAGFEALAGVVIALCLITVIYCGCKYYYAGRYDSFHDADPAAETYVKF